MRYVLGWWSVDRLYCTAAVLVPIHHYASVLDIGFRKLKGSDDDIKIVRQINDSKIASRNP